MADIHTFRRYLFNKHIEWEEVERFNASWYSDRVRETYDYGHPKLNQSKKSFFSGDGVKYVYDHDSIHVAVAPDGIPAYTFYQVEGADVLTSREKFEACDFVVRIRGVMEEAQVLALERSIIPFGTKSADEAFDIALEKICTSITSGWFREFAWENYHSVKQFYVHYGKDYVHKFNEALALGNVKKYEGAS
jgi:hypothetical protein